MTDHSRMRLRLVIAAATVALVALSILVVLIDPGSANAGIRDLYAETKVGAAAGTPVSLTPTPPGLNEPDPLVDDPLDADPLDGDPLDGKPRENDPLDGSPPPRDQPPPSDHQQLEIVRSGRPNDAPRTLTAYDGDPSTIWTPASGADETWIWFDLGTEQRVRAMHLLALGPGEVEIAISSDRRRWQDIARVDTGKGWQEIALRDDARYVRLSLRANDEGEMPSIAEVAIHGTEGSGSRSLTQEQKAANRRERQRTRAPRDNAESRDTGNGGESASGAGQDRGSAGGRITVSTERGETRCRGKRARCKAEEGKVSVEEDCAAEGSCVIDVQADGGTAVCDASGGEPAETDERNDKRSGGNGNKSQAADDEDRRGSDGGECEAVANGGAVAIGDINP
jgi:hypothetical protein